MVVDLQGEYTGTPRRTASSDWEVPVVPVLKEAAERIAAGAAASEGRAEAAQQAQHAQKEGAGDDDAKTLPFTEGAGTDVRERQQQQQQRKLLHKRNQT
jgi:hypothetical protein